MAARAACSVAVTRDRRGPGIRGAGPWSCGGEGSAGFARGTRSFASSGGGGCRVDRVARGRQQRIVQEGQGFLQVRGEETLHRFADPLETPHPSAEFGEFGQGGVATAAAVEQAVDLVHDLPQGAKFRASPGDALQGLPLAVGEAMGHEQIAMIEEVGDASPGAFDAGGVAAGGLGRSSPRQLRQALAARCLRILATACRTAPVSSLMTWNWQT